LHNIAVLIACHNRKEKTFSCLRAVFSQKAEANIHVILVDDGSSDGTAEAVGREFPAVRIIRGSGNLYWNRSMHIAFKTALEGQYDNYLWLNDDTVLYPTALGRLLKETSELQSSHGNAIIIAGSTVDSITGKLTYGGVKRTSTWHPGRFELIQPLSTKPVPCDTINGNCVLISHAAAQKVGNLDWHFIHAIGDFDYGLRAKKKGVPVFVSTGFVGVCSHNPEIGTWQDPSLSLMTRLRKKESPKGLPFFPWLRFCVRHGGIAGIIASFLPYVNLVKSHIKYCNKV
jgi:GT2 family glycosyltransferase